MTTNNTERTSPLLTIVLGYTNTGKTTFIREMLIRNYAGKRVLVCTPHDSEWTDLETVDLYSSKYWNYTGVKRALIFDDGDMAQIVNSSNYFNNGLLVLDDCRFYIRANITQDIKQLLISRKQRAIDIVAAGHGFTEVPPKFFTFCSEIVLFKTSDSIESRKNDIIKFEQCKQLQIKVNAMPNEPVKVFPDGHKITPYKVLKMS